MMKTINLREIFTIKSILISLISLFFILFFVGGCSFKYMDWQYYKFKKLLENESGLYIFDRKLYEEVKSINEYIELPNKKYTLGLLSNGYELLYEVENQENKEVNSRVYSYKDFMYFYYDEKCNKHYISYFLGFSYNIYGLWLVGDEGIGFYLKTEKQIGGYLKKNIFVEDK